MLQALRRYKERSAPTAERFSFAVEIAAAWIVFFPKMGRGFQGRFRRKDIAGFPYVLVYRVRKGELYIAACTHFSQEPGYWLDRLQSR
jgi:hypothetical protein